MGLYASSAMAPRKSSTSSISRCKETIWPVMNIRLSWAHISRRVPQGFSATLPSVLRLMSASRVSTASASLFWRMMVEYTA